MRQKHPALPVVVLSASDRGSDVIRSIDLGAMGFVPKRASNETLFDALRMVMSGGIYVPPITLGGDPPAPTRGGDTVPDVMRVLPQVDIVVGEQAVSAGYQGMASLDRIGLTPRQTEVLAKLLQGKPNKLIARELNLSVETVKDHVAAVLRALNVSSRTQAVLAVSQMQQQGRLAGSTPSRH
jgi:DNA-binding NarL/FixJ family response regulator